MQTSNVILGLAALLGPVAAVIITLWHQSRKEKRDQKFRLFISLMAHRRSNPPSADWVGALNLIDTVFGDTPKVVAAWHDLYDCLCRQPMDWKQYEHLTLDLLAEIAKTLGFKNLKQTDIDKFYTPAAHGQPSKRIAPSVESHRPPSRCATRPRRIRNRALGNAWSL